MSANLMLQGGVAEGWYTVPLPGYPPSIVGVVGPDGQKAVLDLPEDAPDADEAVSLYRFVSSAFACYRREGKAVRYGWYEVVPDGEYVCVDCGERVVVPVVWPREPCRSWASTYHRIKVPDAVR